nr:tyrosine-type recombinase/integrase [uncultured Draconibacterium sp.]
MSFKLSRPNAEKTSIYYYIRKSRQGHSIKLKFYPGISISPDEWDAKNQRVRQRDNIPHVDYNSTLKIIERTVEDVFAENDFFSLTEEAIKGEIEKAINRDTSKSNSKNVVLDLFSFSEDSFYKTAVTLYETERARVGRSAANIKSVANKILKFRPGTDWKDIDYKFYVEYKAWCFSKGDSINTVDQNIKTLRRIMRFGQDLGHVKDPAFLLFKTKSVKAHKIYLDETELDKLHKAEGLPPHIDKAKDLFLLGCWTGMRIENYMTLEETNINLKTKKITYLINKGGRLITIPMHPVVIDILNKYHGKLPDATKDDKDFNKWVRKACELAGITEKIIVVKNVSGKDREVTNEKWKFVTGHTARRSLCTNLYLRGLEVEEIMSITGHDSYKECVGYIKVPLRGIEKPIPKDVWNIKR